MKFSRYASKDGVVFYIALRLKVGVAALIFIFAMLYYLPEGDHLMAESRLRTIAIDFAVQILNLVRFLRLFIVLSHKSHLLLSRDGRQLKYL